MRSLSLVVFAVVALGALALSGCTSCLPPDAATTQAKKPKTPVITCGPGTVVQGNTCIGPAK